MNRMWCGNPERHVAHKWGRWLQHWCGGKRNLAGMLGGRPSP